MIRPKCRLTGCNNLARKVHRRKAGGWYYGKLCQIHHRKKYNMREGGASHGRDLNQMAKRPCEKCGWNESYCDLHRIMPGSKGGKYTKDNVLVLCPNCHRIEHRGRI